MKKSIIALTILASLLTGCASDAEKMAQDQLALEQARRDGAAEARAQLTAQMEEEMAEVVPSWYLDPPKMDGTGVYGVGTAHTKDLGFAVRKAKLVAIYEAAKVFKMEMSGQERSMTRDAGDEGEVADRTELLIDALVARAHALGLAGTVVVARAVAAAGAVACGRSGDGAGAGDKPAATGGGALFRAAAGAKWRGAGAA